MIDDGRERSDYLLSFGFTNHVFKNVEIKSRASDIIGWLLLDCVDESLRYVETCLPLLLCVIS